MVCSIGVYYAHQELVLTLTIFKMLANSKQSIINLLVHKAMTYKDSYCDCHVSIVSKSIGSLYLVHYWSCSLAVRSSTLHVSSKLSVLKPCTECIQLTFLMKDRMNIYSGP